MIIGGVLFVQFYLPHVSHNYSLHNIGYHRPLVGQAEEKGISQTGQRQKLIHTVNTTEKASVPNRGEEIHQENFIGVFTATGYTHTGHKTTSGVWPKRGIVSVDPRVIALGTRLYIENYGEAVALDTGGAIKGYRLDLFYETRWEANQWGRRVVKVYRLE